MVNHAHDSLSELTRLCRLAALAAGANGWRISDGPVAYEAARCAAMDERVAAIAAGQAPEQVWLLEHPPLYTAGTSARPQDLIEARFPVHQSGRGGQFTYHGPGQRVAYVMLDLNRRSAGRARLRRHALEEWIIFARSPPSTCAANGKATTASASGGAAARQRARILKDWPGQDQRPSASGSASGVTLHGISLNVEPELSHFSGIVPCGVSEQRYGVTSLADLGLPVSMADVDMALRAEFEPLFGPTAR